MRIRFLLALLTLGVGGFACAQNLEKGKEINSTCAGCHADLGQGGSRGEYPRLAGQYAEYTETQLKSFRLDERANDAEKVMRTIAAKLSDQQIKAVAEYSASLRP
jgi:cytochrome c553